MVGRLGDCGEDDSRGLRMLGFDKISFCVMSLTCIYLYPVYEAKVKGSGTDATYNFGKTKTGGEKM